MQCRIITVAETYVRLPEIWSRAVVRRTPSKVMKIQELPARLPHSHCRALYSHWNAL